MQCDGRKGHVCLCSRVRAVPAQMGASRWRLLWGHHRQVTVLPQMVLTCQIWVDLLRHLTSWLSNFEQEDSSDCARTLGNRACEQSVLWVFVVTLEIPMGSKGRWVVYLKVDNAFFFSSRNMKTLSVPVWWCPAPISAVSRPF